MCFVAYFAGLVLLACGSVGRGAGQDPPCQHLPKPSLPGSAKVETQVGAP